MHDAKGKELKEGDLVLIPMKVKSLAANDEYCNCELESLYGRRPDGAKEHLSSVNTGVVLRANEDDEIDTDELAALAAPAPVDDEQEPE